MNGVKKSRCNWHNISDFILFTVLFPCTVFQTLEQPISVSRMLAQFCIKCWLCVNGLLTIGRIWRNHVTQVWKISYSAVCRSSSCFKQQIAIFPVDGKPELFFGMLGLFGFLQENLCFKFGRSGKSSQDMEYPDASLDDWLSWGFT